MASQKVPSVIVIHLFTEIISSIMQLSINFLFFSVLLFQFSTPVTWARFSNYTSCIQVLILGLLWRNLGQEYNF